MMRSGRGVHSAGTVSTSSTECVGSARHGTAGSRHTVHRLRLMPRASAGLVIATAAAALVPASSKRVEGVTTLSARQARVVTKFCFDFNAACKEECTTREENPGTLEFHIYSARRTDADGEDSAGGRPELHLAMLDDEYFSFPEVSQVWGEANCTDVLKAAKQSYSLHWDEIKTQAGESLSPGVVERLRPRWWYVALVSCHPGEFELSYKMHLANELQGWQKEFSMDEQGMYMMTMMFMSVFGGLVALHSTSMQRWRELSRTGSWMKLHPALQLVTAIAVFSAVGEAAWFLYYRQYQSKGEAAQHLAILGRGSIVAAKTCMSLLLMFFAQGECVCTPDILWHQHHELVSGMVGFGVFQFALELWGDSTFQNTTTEYIYDTTPGIVLVAFDCLWLWMYVSRSCKTFASETRLKARVFYKRYGVMFTLWFLQLPLIAALARAVAAHVRFRVTAMVSNVVHIIVLAVLVHSFRPAVALELYDLKETEYEAVKHDEELDAMLGKDHDEFI